VDSDSTGNGERYGRPPAGGAGLPPRPHRAPTPPGPLPDEEFIEARPSRWQLRTSLILSLVGAVSLAALTGGAWALRDASSSCTGRPQLLRVTASPDIAPALTQVANRFNVQTHDVRGRCVRVEVRARESAATARALAGDTFVGALAEADAWVPDSSMWVTVARASNAGAKSVLPEITPLATSPVVLATPRPVAAEFRKKKIKPSWRMTFPPTARLFGGPSNKAKISAQIQDPATNASGIAAMIAARQIIGNNKRSSALLTGYVRGYQRNAAGNAEALLANLGGLAQNGRPLVVTTEQSVVGYNLANRPNPAAALVPDEGTLSLDYPFVVTTKDAVRREAAEAFLLQLQSRLGQDAMQRTGFRSPSGAAAPDVAARYGLTAQPPKQLLKITPGQVNEALQAWNRLGLGSRILVLNDISGTMAFPVPGTNKTRMQVAVEAGLTGLRLFPDDTDMGVWEFSTRLDGDKDYRVRVPLGPITDRLENGRTRRKEIERVTAGLAPKLTGDTGLYDSLLAAYRNVKQEWRPDKFNSVLVLTDGVGNDDPGGGLSYRELREKLAAEADPRRPIQVIIVAFGPDVDPVVMRQIARATGGAAYVTEDPREIVGVFMDAIGRRICNPNCG
jgi:hypothetical protein